MPTEMIPILVAILLCPLALATPPILQPLWVSALSDELPKCWGCVPQEMYEQPALGIELAPDYATAAIRYANGSVEDLVMVEAEPDYIRLLHHLQKDWDKFDAVDNLPSSLEVMDTMMQKLRTALMPRLGNATLHTAVSMMALLTLDFDDVMAAMLVNNMQPIVGGDDGMIHRRVPAVAGFVFAHGGNLCEHYRSLLRCEAEKMELPEHTAMSYHFSNSSLIATTVLWGGGYEPNDIPQQQWTWEAGKRHMPADDDDPNDPYWDALDETIVMYPLMMRESFGMCIGEYFVMGSEGDDPRLLRHVHDVLQEYLCDNDDPHRPHILQRDNHIDPTFAAARGAAEWGKRRMEQPNDCVERWYCDWWREHQQAPTFEL